MSLNIEELNQLFGQTIGMTLIDTSSLLSLLIRFVITTVVVGVIARGFYYPKSRRRDYMFIFIIMSMSIFLLVSFMGGDSIPTREMTYLFMLVAVSVVNASV